MLKSLFSGVSGLQSHQVAMDVEANNIANVNTVGFKYSRANFSDLLAQTKAIATAPQGELGGKNPVQVGLGSTVSSMTRIFSQGSVQNSDKNTDVAIQGDGFYIVSPDGGNTYKYTRAGDFKFDAKGNFVDNNGFIVQGWLRDSITGKVDATAPITNINIPPGLTTPASATKQVVLKANLNSGPTVDSFSPAYQINSGSTNIQPAAVDANGNAISAGNIGVMFNEVGEAFAIQENQGVWASFLSSKLTAGTVVANTALDVTFNVDPELGIPGNAVQVTAVAGATVAETANNYVNAINAKSSITGIAASVDAANEITFINTNGSNTASHNINFVVASGSGLASGTNVTAHRYQYNKSSAANIAGGDKTFTSMADLRKWMEDEARNQGFISGGTLTNGITVEVNDAGKFVVKNPNNGVDDFDINLKITAYTDKTIGAVITNNTKFTKNMEALSTVLPQASGGQASSGSFNAATHSSSIDVFDSLGSKHTLRVVFRKTQLDISTGSTWDMQVSVPSPATIDTTPPFNEKTGSIRFNNDGSLSTYNPPNISFSGNNGSAPNQQVNLIFGSGSSFNGMTSFDSKSSTSKIAQDGYTGGDLVGIRIDQSGTLVGSFSNGRSFALAQIGMAKFTNNEGLSTEGGNIFIQTANSGDPIIGTAASGGRGFIQAAALEASNVDLSRALTQLIIIQRGFQANGKTITTSDQLLQTLIGLKN
ncbi:flagellar hook protein FlgE [Sulfurimonas sp.]|uniref:flagellar hook protein FlgE n=1 Tax=Sulfurimonas sp. TaxID=2022749 RepID=UPI002B46F1F7|nr:flagellar hook protein FlgE [Sulfurimonas sp.]